MLKSGLICLLTISLMLSDRGVKNTVIKNNLSSGSKNAKMKMIAKGIAAMINEFETR